MLGSNSHPAPRADFGLGAPCRAGLMMKQLLGSSFSEILGVGALSRLEVGPELVHVIQGLGQESPSSVDLHQG